MAKYVTPKEAAQILLISQKTLRNWDRDGRIKTTRTPTGHRRYDVESVSNLYTPAKTTILYCRVSSAKQKDDLNKQADYLQSLFPTGIVYKEIGSGLNYKRKVFMSILDEILSGNVGQLVVTYKDRLARFGVELLEWLLSKYNCQLVVLNRSDLSPEREMVEDILAIIHVFSYRLHGLRKYKNQIKTDQNLPG